ncbi:tetratricopeptide repeat protein [Desulfomarina sp.]
MPTAKTSFLSIIFIFLLLLPFLPARANETNACKKYIETAGRLIKADHHFEASDALRKAIDLDDSRHPSLHMKLAVLYYSLSLIPDAIREGEKAVNHNPSSKWFKYDLGKFYFANNQLDKAEKQFTTLLSLDPGFTFAYYYLAEVYFQKQRYDLAWLSLSRARFLGFKGTFLKEKLLPLTRKPTEDFEKTSDDKLFRFIKLPSREKAEEVLQNIRSGKLFEKMELQLKKDHLSGFGYGIMTLSELKKTIADTLKTSKPYSSPKMIKTGSDYRIMQRIMAFNPSAWQALTGKSARPPYRSAQEETENPSREKPTAENRFSARLAAFYALENWKNSWENGDLKAYFGAYSDSFMPADQTNLARWKKKRENSLTLPKFIHIDLVNPVIEMIQPGKITITFQQIYESDRYADRIIKKLTFNREPDGWKIIREETVRNLPDPG